MSKGSIKGGTSKRKLNELKGFIRSEGVNNGRPIISNGIRN